MALNKEVFLKRTASAVVFSVIMLGGLMWNTWSILVLTLGIQFLCIREFVALIGHMDRDVKWSKGFVWLFQTVSAIWLLLPSFYYQTVSPWPMFLCSPSLILSVAFLSKNGNWRSGMYAVFAIIYIVIPMVLLLQMHSINTLIPIAIILMIWTSDTMAYLVGSFIGKHPVSTVSPGKTWEGIIGGGILTIVCGGVLGYYSQRYNIYDWMILSLIVSITAPVGDLLESKMKRIAGVKDSGTLMPGHGGALDRFDSLLVVVPFVYCYVWRFMPSLF